MTDKKEPSIEELAKGVVDLVMKAKQQDRGYGFNLDDIRGALEQLADRYIRKEVGTRSRDAVLGSHVRAIVEDLFKK